MNIMTRFMNIAMQNILTSMAIMFSDYIKKFRGYKIASGNSTIMQKSWTFSLRWGCSFICLMITPQNLASSNLFLFERIDIPLLKFIVVSLPAMRLITQYPYKMYSYIKYFIHYCKIRSEDEVEYRFSYEIIITADNLDNDIIDMTEYIHLLTIYFNRGMLSSYGPFPSLCSKPHVNNEGVNTLDNIKPTIT
ncbi:hypothetical protein C922_04224 [Plasmodium inui San Antonio 1]|uniref:Uncharacterized protein n=1 Tax=Plasmodium inui San Antonio 1 TaxID=1237626 RepID=W7A8J9_9APIC|nr:hypothetical protein C922_04224 [Plasmodium inui San Antonio 1]EUD65484.1 hypothetical protein C922_04224 [Plasmodium inui San Antonio 1]